MRQRKMRLWIAGMTLAAAVMLVPAPREASAFAAVPHATLDVHPTSACCDKVDPDIDCYCSGKWHDNRCESTCSSAI